MAAQDLRIPAFVKQPSILQHPSLVRIRERAEGATADVGIATEAFVAARRNLPSCRAHAKRQIGLVPFGWNERLVEQPHTFETLTPDHPWPDGAVDFLQS